MEGKDGTIRVLGIHADRYEGGIASGVVVTDGRSLFDVSKSGWAPYSTIELLEMDAAIATPDGTAAKLVAKTVENHAAQFIQAAGSPDLIGFHGEMLAMWVARKTCVMAGSAALLATSAQIPVASNFYDQDLAFGGKGGPIYATFLHALARWAQRDLPICFVDLGRVSRIIVVDPRVEEAGAPGAILAFDACPGLARIQRAATFADELSRDALARFMMDGRINEDHAIDAQDEIYASISPPKWLDRDSFPMLLPIEGQSMEDWLATAGAAIATAIAQEVAQLGLPDIEVVPFGLGASIEGMINNLGAALGAPCSTIEDFGVSSKELPGFAAAFVGARIKFGLPTTFPMTSGVAAPIGGGQVFGR